MEKKLILQKKFSKEKSFNIMKMTADTGDPVPKTICLIPSSSNFAEPSGNTTPNSSFFPKYGVKWEDSKKLENFP